MTLRSGPTLVIGLVLLVACTPVPAPSPSASAAPSSAESPAFPEPSLPPDATAWDRLIARVGAAGEPDLQAALDAFAIAFSPLPGTQPPPGERTGPLEDGTTAVRWIRQFWGELTGEQQAYAAAIINGELPTPVGGRFGLAAVGRAPMSEPRVSQSEPIDWPALAVDLEPVLAQLFGRQLQAEVKVNQLLSVIEVPSDLDYWNSGAWVDPTDAAGDVYGQMHTCTINIPPWTQALSLPRAKELMAHELFHCFEIDLDPIGGQLGVPTWVGEGGATWAAMTIGGGVYDGPVSWQEWLDNPLFPLYARDYDAHGIYWLLENSGVNPWTVMDEHLRASRHGTEAAYVVLWQAGGELFLNTWGSRYFMTAPPAPDEWQYRGDGLPDKVSRSHPPLFDVEPQTTFSSAAEVYAATELIARLRSDVVVVETSSPYGLVGFSGGQEPLAEFVGLPICTNPEGCVCSDSSAGAAAEFRLLPFDSLIQAGLTGHLTGIKTTILGMDLGDFCEREPEFTPPPEGLFQPCAEDDCASSNGDPHLTTVDGHAYDFQTAGEFTLIRSPDGSFELQARQEPYQDSDNATINTAAAVAASDDTISMYVTADGMRVVANGADIAVESDSAVGALGIRPVSDGVEVSAPDGTTAWVLTLGDDWGLNVLLAPSDELRGVGRGLLGQVGVGELPALPDGSAVDTAASYRDALYGPFADAWAVSADQSLFAYAPGESPDTFRNPLIPAPEAPLDFSELTPQQQAAGLAACAAITDQFLREQCAFDVIVTADEGFVAAYAGTDLLLAQLGGDACGLLSDKEIVAATGLTVLSKEPDVREGSVGCTWEVDSPDYTEHFAVTLDIFYPGGADELEKQLDFGGGREIEELADAGDQAVTGCCGNVVVLRDDQLVDVGMDALSNNEEALIELMRAVLDRL